MSVLYQAADAYQALKLLAADPRFDAKRIAMVGMSVGGGAAVAATANSIRATQVGVDGPRFAAHVAFYPGLHAAPEAANLSGAPILVLPGAIDDYMSPHRVNAWAKHVRDNRADYPLQVVPVPNGPHSYLNNETPSRYVSEYANASLCPLFLINPEERKFLSIDGAISSDTRCQTTRGGNIGYHSGAAEFALKQAIEFLNATFAAVP